MSTVVSRDILKTFSNHKHMSIKSLSLNAKKIKKTCHMDFAVST